MKMNHGRGNVGAWLIAWAGIVCAGTAATAAEGPWVDPRSMTIPQLGQIQVPAPERIVLKNGMVVYLLEDHEFPLVDARALVRVGSIYEPSEKIGLASITGRVMRTGGSTNISGDALDEKLEGMGASVEIGISDTDGSGSVSTLSADIEEGLKTLADLFRRPAFPEEKIGLAKKQERTEIAARNDELLDVSIRELLKLVYGADHPYARHTEYATIDAITRDDLVRFHQRFFHPERIILTVYGDFESKRVTKQLEQIFGDWPRGTEALPPDPSVEPNKTAQTYLVHKGDATNSCVVLGQLGMRMDDPDYPAMEVLNQVVGAGFSSRLFNEIRTKRGLAYATGSGIGADLHHPGMLVFYAVTQADSTAPTLGYVRQEVRRVLSEPVTPLELRRAKDAIQNSLVFDLSSKGAVLQRIAGYEFYGYPPDFLQQYQDAVQKVTEQDLLAAAKRKIREAELATLVVGNRERFGTSLASLGEIHEIDITIPEPKGEAIPQGSEADFERGQSLLAAAAQATGGPALSALQDLTYEENGTFTVQGMELNIENRTVRRFPDCKRSDQKLPMGTFIQAICGQKGWLDMMQGPQEMPPDQLSEALVDQARDLFTVLRTYPTLKVQALPGEAMVDGRPAEVVHVRSDLVTGWKLYLDKESHLIVRMDYRDRSMEGSLVQAEEDFGDYRDVGGVKWPHSRKILHDGEPVASLTTSSFASNTGVDANLFAMPVR